MFKSYTLILGILFYPLLNAQVPLLYAAHAGDKNAIAAHLSTGGDINTVDVNGHNAIYHLSTGLMETIEHELTSKNITKKISTYRSCLLFLLANNITLGEQKELLKIMTYTFQVELLELVLQAGVDAGQALDETGMTALDYIESLWSERFNFHTSYTARKMFTLEDYFTRKRYHNCKRLLKKYGAYRAKNPGINVFDWLTRV